MNGRGKRGKVPFKANKRGDSYPEKICDYQKRKNGRERERETPGKTKCGIGSKTKSGYALPRQRRGGSASTLSRRKVSKPVFELNKANRGGG